MPQRQILGFIGSLILFIGVFAPILSVPIVGSVNYFQNGRGDGVIILILAVISFFITLAQKYKALLITGLGSLALLAFTFVHFQLRMTDARSEMQRSLSNNPFKGLGDAMLDSVQISWGWAVLIIGAGFLVAAALWKENINQVTETNSYLGNDTKNGTSNSSGALGFLFDERLLLLIAALVGYVTIGFGIYFIYSDLTVFNDSNSDKIAAGFFICLGLAMVGYAGYSIWKK